MFQFYDSPIKRETKTYVLITSEFTFQFYDSPIKRQSGVVLKRLGNCFNSMIVRLKVANTKPPASNVLRFQFYDSPIKSPCMHVKDSIAIAGFNSMIVRLKVIVINKENRQPLIVSIL